MPEVKVTIIELPEEERYKARREVLVAMWWEFCKNSPTIPSFREFVLTNYKSEFDQIFQDDTTRGVKPPL